MIEIGLADAKTTLKRNSGAPKTSHFEVIFWFHDEEEDDNTFFHGIGLNFDVSSLIFLKVRLCQTSISLENSRGFKGF